MAKAGHRYQGLSRGRTAKRGEMNKTEAEYSLLLNAQIDAGEIAAWWFEPFSLRLSWPPEGQPARYTPDFLILMVDGTTIVVDVKGTGVDSDASLVRIKCAAEQYFLWEFRIVKKRTKKAGGGWNVKIV